MDTKKDTEVTKESDRAALDASLHASTVVISAINNTTELTKVLLDGDVLRGDAESKVVKSGKGLVCALPGADLVSNCYPTPSIKKRQTKHK